MHNFNRHIILSYVFNEYYWVPLVLFFGFKMYKYLVIHYGPIELMKRHRAFTGLQEQIKSTQLWLLKSMGVWTIAFFVTFGFLCIF